MSQSAVLAAVQTHLAAVVGSSTRVYHGTPTPLPYTEWPIAIVDLGLTTPVQQTFGVAGQTAVSYPVSIRLVLGAKDCRPTEAATRRLGLPEKMRAAFVADWTLGGACWNSDLVAGPDNLAEGAYAVAGDEPALRWTLQVTEMVAANAPA